MDEFAETLAELAELGGEGQIDHKDDHERWRLYSNTLANLDDLRLRLLFQAVGWEDDPAIALSVVLRVLEVIPTADRTSWIHRLADDRSRDYASARAHDISILESLTEPSMDVEPGYVEQEWSEWLQIRLATLSRDARILTHLANSGSTKRIRRTASEHLGK
ncbi:hypothetical protein AB0395_09965 [Streptosporangium sp. NPDC051023]|uniref:hypothetical protein n=1 Tax=Streptosporangium sp. NPDC051023 TaxID=3155410 RepID=UPI00344F2C78